MAKTFLRDLYPPRFRRSNSNCNESLLVSRRNVASPERTKISPSDRVARDLARKDAVELDSYFYHWNSSNFKEK